MNFHIFCFYAYDLISVHKIHTCNFSISNICICDTDPLSIYKTHTRVVSVLGGETAEKEAPSIFCIYNTNQSFIYKIHTCVVSVLGGETAEKEAPPRLLVYEPEKSQFLGVPLLLL